MLCNLQGCWEYWLESTEGSAILSLIHLNKRFQRWYRVSTITTWTMWDTVSILGDLRNLIRKTPDQPAVGVCFDDCQTQFLTALILVAGDWNNYLSELKNIPHAEKWSQVYFFSQKEIEPQRWRLTSKHLK